MKFYPAIRTIVSKLQQELPGWLTYHDYDHVRDVYRIAREIGRAEGLDEDNLKLVLTAAILHDIGFIGGPREHEKSSCDIAREILPKFEYTADQIAEIEGMIMVTSIPHKPENLMQMIMCDADLDYLGRDDFSTRAEQLYKEFIVMGIVNDRKSWNEVQVKFLNMHRYFTRTSIESRTEKKAAHLRLIQEELSRM
jgi:HD superfamily phosphodiesterase